jgi:two-component system, response regulator PdtaR
MPHCSVLVVEDEFLVAMEIEHCLTDAGYEVCGTAASEGDAIRLAVDRKPKLAVVDVRLAPGSGIEVAKVLERMGTGVLFATAHCRELQENPDAVHTLCIMKPYQVHKLPMALSLLEQGADHLPGPLPPGVIRI